MNREYIVDFCFGTWRNQIWFSGNDDGAFKKAQQHLSEVGAGCSNSNDFFNQAVKHFESYGFYRIQK